MATVESDQPHHGARLCSAAVARARLLGEIPGPGRGRGDFSAPPYGQSKLTCARCSVPLCLKADQEPGRTRRCA